MSDVIIVEYCGFEAKTLVREYTFRVREAAVEPREYTLTIPNEAFDSHRARYQDAPDICSVRLRQELAAGANHPLKTHYRISDAELDDYCTAHRPKSARSPYAPKPARDF